MFVDEPTARPRSSRGGNFHGQPLALALDLAAMAVAELANISERRVEQLVNPALSSGLPPFLAQRNSGLDSGFMIAQVASASLVSENKVLCHPASVDSIPSSAGQRGPRLDGERERAEARASRRERARVARHRDPDRGAGLDQRLPLRPSSGSRAAYGAVRELVPVMMEDRPLYRDIGAVGGLLSSGKLLTYVENEVGALA